MLADELCFSFFLTYIYTVSILGHPEAAIVERREEIGGGGEGRKAKLVTSLLFRRFLPAATRSAPGSPRMYRKATDDVRSLLVVVVQKLFKHICRTEDRHYQFLCV